MSGHNHITKITNKSSASEVKGVTSHSTVNAGRMANLVDTEAGGAAEERYDDGKKKER
jgi:hypothetical protein